ncbi:hypothetical protein MOF05_07745 [Bacillus haynesii]|uniref:hypothetical protein n=1 Tax=Bacillus TaxID=1386 RepID=UPI0022812539|nr:MULTISPECIES: hypothetical protein [Bacillus]MCY7773448.1 hypothetical protein [Bacillus licheniformis]MCY7780159.1 hypothetical protein [Bacillus haynesii]MCY8021528.1 hypothetical protein [Bacillus licheniformis]MCY8530070.1 hypothetical protein [Bacillus licheniformis]MCY9266921.1 hypothetical protein [Bacillus licheniformis]
MLVDEYISFLEKAKENAHRMSVYRIFSDLKMAKELQSKGQKELLVIDPKKEIAADFSLMSKNR